MPAVAKNVSAIKGKVSRIIKPAKVEKKIGRNLKVRKKNTFGYDVSMYREKYGMTIQDLADSLGISAGTLSSNELGNTSPTPKTVDKIIRFFGVSGQAEKRLLAYATNRTFTRHGAEKSDLETRLFMTAIKDLLKHDPILSKSGVLRCLKESGLK